MSVKESEGNNNTTPAKHESFHFGEYISPNPKRIPLNIDLQPAASIEYETNKTIKTESKPQQAMRSNDANEEKSERYHPLKQHQVVIAPTPLKEKVGKQQQQIELLQSQILKLQLENERLQSVSPENEATNDGSTTPKSKHIAFDPSVRIMDPAPHAPNMALNDKVSVMRAKRHATPYKSKPKQPLTRNVMNVIKKREHEESSRSHYRITPIPQKRNKQVRFKSKLQPVCDKENVDEEASNIKEPQSTLHIPDQNVDLETSATFNLLGSSETPSFLRADATPDRSPSGKNFNFGGSAQPNDAIANVLSPTIVTPAKGSDHNAKPFAFSWNKRK
eukprot:412043_1